MTELTEKAENRYKLLRFQKKVEALCKSRNVNFTAPTKRPSTISKINYIKDLIQKLQIESGEKNGIVDFNIHSTIPNINPDYKKYSTETNSQHAAFIRQTLKFEDYMYNLHHNRCHICRQRRLKLVVNKEGICSRCEQQRGNYIYCHENKTLPTWNYNGSVMYSIPNVLQNLTIAEKLLIQRVSPLIPVIHIKNGSLGSRGHVVSFYQDISGLCNELPRLPSNVSIVKVIRSGTTKDGEDVSNSFTVNRYRVLSALKWLKRYNPLYRDITIREANLTWMKGNITDTLETTVTIESTELDDEDKDRGPSEVQVLKPYEAVENPDYESYGCISGESTQIISDDDKKLAEALYKEGKKRNTPRLNWPTREVKPISEYNDLKLFCLAFPWLYPGGVGDINESRQHAIEVSEWAQNLLYYEDGRFAKDKLWGFFTLNYIQRHRNQSQGHWFIKDFVGTVPPSLDSLHDQIMSGDHTFIDKLMYFGKVVPGSSAYWRSKKAELYSWISHHIEKGRGAPNIFLTLSCAEYFWPDLKRLLEEFIYAAEGRRVNLSLNHTELQKALNDYTLVVQEFFHLRVDEYLKTIGFHAFGITHYWGRFEFAKSRGQIHLHLLAITNDALGENGIYTQLFNQKGNKSKQTELLSNWARSKFKVTAEVNTDNDNPHEATSPCNMRFCQTTCMKEDGNNILNFCQMHNCSDYCMRDKKYLKTEENDGIKMNIEVGNLLFMMTIIRNDMDEKQNVFFFHFNYRTR